MNVTSHGPQSLSISHADVLPVRRTPPQQPLRSLDGGLLG
jgi:hypothetical protein